MTDDYPATLRRASVRGMLSGPFRYLRSRRAQARVAADRAARSWSLRGGLSGWLATVTAAHQVSHLLHLSMYDQSLDGRRLSGPSGQRGRR